jgi:hypothetical protein
VQQRMRQIEVKVGIPDLCLLPRGDNTMIHHSICSGGCWVDRRIVWLMVGVWEGGGNDIFEFFLWSTDELVRQIEEDTCTGGKATGLFGVTLPFFDRDSGLRDWV